MPVITSSYDDVPFYCLNGHFETIIPHLFRRVNIRYERDRFDLSDGDFLDLDWIKNSNARLIVLCHGLEGSAHSQYMKGMARSGMEAGYDVLAINWRSCSGEMNRKACFYHHGETEDLREVVDHIIEDLSYRAIYMTGFSLGGNVIAKYLSQEGEGLAGTIKRAVAVSTPGHLASSSALLDQRQNYLYSRRFRRSLRRKFQAKKEILPEDIDLDKFGEFSKWTEWDDYFTTKLYGFSGAEEYYEQGSANNFLPDIPIPFLLLNALNDPFLDEQSYPYELAKASEYIYLETPKRGGHVGFLQAGSSKTYYEEKALDFFEE